MLFLELLIIILLILMNGFFAASEISLISLRKSRVRHLVKSGNTNARRIQKLQEEPERFLATVQIVRDSHRHAGGHVRWRNRH